MKPAERPMGGPTSRDVFGLNIVPDPKSKGKQRFEIWAGSDDNRIEVTAIDAKQNQLILFVQEAPRTFVEHRPKPWRRDEKAELVLAPGERLVSENMFAWDVERTAPSAKRHYLCGVDERGYFASQLPKAVTTVRAAHDALKSTSAKNARKKDKIIRQGEWFFIPIKADERKLLDEALKKKLIAIAKNTSIHRALQVGGGNPHTCSEIVVLPSRSVNVQGLGEIQRVDRTAYVRGKVKHREHATIEFFDWHRIERNTEILTNGRGTGVAWID